MNLLLVEPDRVLAKTYGQYLHEAGHTVIAVRGAQQAVHASDGKRLDLIILELQLTDHSGVEFLYEFRSYPEWQDIPVLLHTMVPPQALAIPEPLIDQLHIKGYLYKPSTTLRKLLSTIHEVTATVNI